MFTPEARNRLRDALLDAARADPRITGAALTGSAALDREDRWSDIDLAFGVEGGIGPAMAAWTERRYTEHGAIHHMDVRSGATIYRVFLLASTLQVDIAFSPSARFGATAPTFRLLYGTAEEQPWTAPPSATGLIDLAWLHALHVRSSVFRGRVWQTEYMISAIRDYVLALACLRHDVPASQGRGLDLLPAAVTAGLEGALVRSLETDELVRAFGVVTEALLVEIGEADTGLAERLTAPLRELKDLQPG